MTSREALIDEYEKASASDDFETMARLRHPDWQMQWPQSEEIVKSHADYVAIRTNRPEGVAPRVEPRRYGGSSDTWWSEFVIHYADGSRWLGITIFEFKGDLVRGERVYFGQPFAPPPWRAKWVQKGQPAIDKAVAISSHGE